MEKAGWALLALCVGALAWIAAASAAAAEGVHAFRVTGPEGGSSVLLGTIHLGDPRIVQPSAAILDGAKRLVVESRPENEPPRPPGDQFDLTAIMTGKDGKPGRARWVSALTPEDVELLKAYLVCSVGPSQADQMLGYVLAFKAWAAAGSVALPCPHSAELSRDDMLKQRADKMGIPVVALESVEENRRQRDALIASLGEQVFVDSVKYSLRPVGTQAIADFIAAINAGNFDEVLRITRRYAVDASEVEGYDRYMIRGRNALWMPRLEQYLQGGSAVVLVGAGHLAGPDGLVALLRRDGYAVQPVLLPEVDTHP